MGRLIGGALELYCAFFALLLLLLTLKKKVRSRASFLSRVMMTTCLVMLLSDGAAVCFFSELPLVNKGLHLLSFAAFYAISGQYVLYIRQALSIPQSRNVKALTALSFGVNTLGFLFWAVNCFSPLFFDIQTNEVTNAKLHALSIVPGALSLLIALGLVLFYRSKTAFSNALLLMAIPLLPFVSSLVGQLVPGLSLQYALIFLCLVLNHSRFDLFKDKQIEQRDAEIQKLQLLLTLEHVKPHFIYNVLTSIYFLCDSDPALAQQALGLFSSFLRKALHNMEATALVPFARELELVQNYLHLESMRFSDRLQVSYHLDVTAFSLPPFSLQPLVENAVKHGLQNGAGGKIQIATREEDDAYLVIVIDNGAGFDPDEADLNNKPSGIRNIQQLLSLTGSGELEIISKKGKTGTKAVLHLQKHLQKSDSL